MMHYSLFCVPAINNKSKAVLGIYNQDLFYQGFFIPITLNCIITREYWQNLKQQRKVLRQQQQQVYFKLNIAYKARARN